MNVVELEQNVRQALQILAREDLIHSEVEFQAQKRAETIFEYLVLDFIENASMHFAFSLPLLLRMGFVRKQCDQR